MAKSGKVHPARTLFREPNDHKRLDLVTALRRFASALESRGQDVQELSKILDALEGEGKVNPNDIESVLLALAGNVYDNSFKQLSFDMDLYDVVGSKFQLACSADKSQDQWPEWASEEFRLCLDNLTDYVRKDNIHALITLQHLQDFLTRISQIKVEELRTLERLRTAETQLLDKCCDSLVAEYSLRGEVINHAIEIEEDLIKALDQVAVIKAYLKQDVMVQGQPDVQQCSVYVKDLQAAIAQIQRHLFYFFLTNTLLTLLTFLLPSDSSGLDLSFGILELPGVPIFTENSCKVLRA